MRNREQDIVICSTSHNARSAVQHIRLANQLGGSRCIQWG